MLFSGEYHIEVTYFGQPVTGSPFTAKAWDMNKVNVSNVVQGRVGLQSSFNSKLTTAGLDHPHLVEVYSPVINQSLVFGCFFLRLSFRLS